MYTHNIEDSYMEMKSNKEAVKDYHKKLNNIQIRIPAPSDTIPDYKDMIMKHAKSKNLSLNAYVLSLIEKDMGIEIKKGIRDCK